MAATEPESLVIPPANVSVGPPLTTLGSAVQFGPSSIAATVVGPAAQRETTSPVTPPLLVTKSRLMVPLMRSAV